MKIAVTGATGFIGRALCSHLAIVDDYIVVPAVSHVSGLPHEIVVGNNNATMDWRSVLARCEAVVHLGARVHRMDMTPRNPLALYRASNTDTTLNLARQATESGVKRFVFISTAKVNGEGRESPYTEIDPATPEDAYAISKWEAEQGLHQIARETGLEVVVLRPPLVYGPGVTANFLNMMRWLYKGVPLPLGAIHNRRSLVGLDNLVDFIVICLDHPAATNQTFLVGDGEDISTTDLLRRMAEALKVPARLIPVPQNLLEASLKLIGKNALAHRLCGSLRLDISKAETVLDWHSPLSVHEGLQRTADYFLQGRS